MAEPYMSSKFLIGHVLYLGDWEPSTSWGPGVRRKEPLSQSEPHPSSQDPLQQRTAWAISQLATRRYRASCKRTRSEWPDSGSSCSSAPVCAICLEEFSEGQVRQGSWLTSVARLGREARASGKRHVRLVWVLWLHLCPMYPAWGRGR